MAKFIIGSTVIKLPVISSIHTVGKDIVLVFKDKDIYPPLRYTPSGVEYISGFDNDDRYCRRPSYDWKSIMSFCEEFLNVQKEDAKELVSEKFPKRSRCKKSELG